MADPEAVQAAVAVIQQLVDEINVAVHRVEAWLGTQTWVGSPTRQWEEEFAERRAALAGFLDGPVSAEVDEVLLRASHIHRKE
ncbi:hypothetical protein [Rhizohabitans arisaemae]|uniref:hypothetical protein n=1 Tax=Rhizohabitans arisaemae TaxID=2720610 RepID=UPI0024B0EC47|nr:hypothetical protein [Rhizohabitans arisaemae]